MNVMLLSCREPLDFPRSWLLVVMREHVRNTQLAFYLEQLLPLTGQMKQYAHQWRDRGKEREAILFDTLESQVIECYSLTLPYQFLFTSSLL